MIEPKTREQWCEELCDAGKIETTYNKEFARVLRIIYEITKRAKVEALEKIHTRLAHAINSGEEHPALTVFNELTAEINRIKEDKP